MADFDVFNGDADGITALLQLRLAAPRAAQLITGIKRDIALLQRVVQQRAAAGDRVAVLDLSLDKNRTALEQLLAVEAEVFYCDHHFAGQLPHSSRLLSLINESPEVCTSLLVNGYLRGRYAPWAVVGAYGDNLHQSATRLAAQIGLSQAEMAALCELGELINYNGYGESLADLHFDPADLYRQMSPFSSPLALLAANPPFIATLRQGRAADSAALVEAKTLLHSDIGIVKQLPNRAWARRISGVWANQLARDNPHHAIALLTEREGGYLVSVRAPRAQPRGAVELCRQFAGGGGRAAAAGINVLPESEKIQFIEKLSSHFNAL